MEEERTAGEVGTVETTSAEVAGVDGFLFLGGVLVGVLVGVLEAGLEGSLEGPLEEDLVRVTSELLEGVLEGVFGEDLREDLDAVDKEAFGFAGDLVGTRVKNKQKFQ